MVGFHLQEMVNINAPAGRVTGAEPRIDLDYWVPSSRELPGYVVHTDERARIEGHASMLPDRYSVSLRRERARNRPPFACSIREPDDVGYWLRGGGRAGPGAARSPWDRASWRSDRYLPSARTR